MPHVDETETDEERAANARSIAKVKEAKEADDDGDDDELRADAPEPKQEDDEIRPSRAEKKRERGQNLVRQAKEEADAARRETAELRGRLDELSRRQQAPAPAAEPKEDPLIAERDQLRKEYNAHMSRFREVSSKEGVTQAEIDKLQEEAWELKDRMDTNVVRREMARNKPAADAEALKTSQQNAQTQLHARHGDVTRDARATKFFQANYAKLLASGAPDTWETLDLAMDQTRTELRMTPRGGPPAPSAAQKQRLSGMGRGGGGSGAEPKEKGIKLTPEIKKMANAAYPHLPKEKRLQAWANASGKHFLEES